MSMNELEHEKEVGEGGARGGTDVKITYTKREGSLGGLNSLTCR